MVRKAALVLALVAGSASAGPGLSADARYDLTCAEATAWALSWIEQSKSEEARNNLLEVNFFYLGRLSGRDNETDWAVMVKTELAAKREDETFYSDALNSCAQRMYEKLMPKRAG